LTGKPGDPKGKAPMSSTLPADDEESAMRFHMEQKMGADESDSNLSLRIYKSLRKADTSSIKKEIENRRARVSSPEDEVANPKRMLDRGALAKRPNEAVGGGGGGAAPAAAASGPPKCKSCGCSDYKKSMFSAACSKCSHHHGG